MRSGRLSFLASVACGAAMAFCSVAAPVAVAQYHVEAKWAVGGEGGWDYIAIDPVSHFLYVTRGTHVLVIDTANGKTVADITGLKGVHGVAFDTKSNNGYITDGGSNSVAVFDRKTNKIIATVPAGDHPDGIAFEPVTGTVWAFNGRSKNATVISTATNQVVATIALPGKPEFPAADGKGTVFVNIEDTSQLASIDAKTYKVTNVWPLAPCEGPSGLAIDRISRRLFSVCDGKKMAVVNADTGKVEATPEIGDGPDAAGFDAKQQVAFSSNGEGTLTVVHEDSPDKYSVLQTVTTQRGARTMALDEATGKVYLVTADFGPRPEATKENPRPRPPMIPGTFVVLVISR